MKGLAFAGSLLLWAAAAFSEEVLREIEWPDLKEKGQLAAGEIVRSEKSGGPAYLKLENAESREARIGVFTLENPGVTRYTYALRGQVRYQDVAGQGYLEMLSHFPEGAYFSRTLDSRGPLKSLSGSSEWRSVVLPFYNKEGGPHPRKLEVSLVLPGRGTVFLGPLRLVQFGPGEDPLAAEGQWFSDRQAGLFGGLAGGLVGILGAIAGTLGSLGKARGLVLGIMKSMMAVGVACLALGSVAVTRGQPYGVYYTFLLFGAICAFVPAGAQRNLRRRYEEMELRKMKALDAS